MTRSNYFYIGFVKGHLAITESPSVQYEYDKKIFHWVSKEDRRHVPMFRYTTTRKQTEYFVDLHYDKLCQEYRKHPERYEITGQVY